MPDIEVVVIADADVPLHFSETVHVFSTGANAAVGYSVAGAQNLAFAARFQDVPIPQGAEIQSAAVRLEAAADQAEVVVNARVDGLASDNSGTPTHAEFDGGSVLGSGHGRASANRTTAQVVWSAIPAWTLGKVYDTPDISVVLQEIVNRSGWVKGNALTLFIGDEDQESDQVDVHIRAGLYTAPRPRLLITYVAIPVDPAQISIELGAGPPGLARQVAETLTLAERAQVE